MEPITRYATVSTALAAALLFAAPAAQAQNEAALRSAFEGKRVTLRLDMPGSSDGVDVRVGAAQVIDFRKYGADLKKYGISLAAGDSTTITMVRVKKDLIEFQLGGGGFGTFGDDTSTTAYLPRVDKSSREKDLERRVKEETDRERKRQLERDLDAERNRRERENRRIAAEEDRIEAEKRERVAEQRLRGGSRFNIRYVDRVPANIAPEDVVAALREYVDFRNDDRRSPAPPAPSASSPTGGDPSRLRKGMLRAEVERLLGRPALTSEKRTPDFTTVLLTFDSGDQRITAEFVDDVLVRYTIASR